MILLLVVPGLQAAEVGGYFRLMARPDLIGGDGRLGMSSYQGRLLNEGPWGLLDVRQALVKPEGTNPWGDLHLRVEGGSAAGAEPTNGSLLGFRMSQIYLQAGNLGLPNVTWRVGTLETTFGDLWLFDARPTQLMLDVLGGAATWAHDGTELTVGVGDAGWTLHGAHYHAVPSGGGSVRHTFAGLVTIGVSGQLWYEPADALDPDAPRDTPGLGLGDWQDGTPATSWLATHPGKDLPAAVPTAGRGWKVAGLVGLGRIGPVMSDRLQVVWQRRLPDAPTTEMIDGVAHVVGAASLTDQRDELLVGNELELEVIPDRLEVAWASMLDIHRDPDDVDPASPENRTGVYTVARTQLGVTHTISLLGETSFTREMSHHGPAFASKPGLVDQQRRDTLQVKGGLVLSPAGPGLGDRPALRLLYGMQHCTEANAWPGASAEADRHWHSLVSLEGEAWF